MGFSWGLVAMQKSGGLLGTELENRFQGFRRRKTIFALLAVVTNFDEDKGNADKEM